MVKVIERRYDGKKIFIADLFIAEDNPTKHYGQLWWLEAGGGSAGRRFMYLRIKLPEEPAEGSEIEKITLRLWRTGGSVSRGNWRVICSVAGERDIFESGVDYKFAGAVWSRYDGVNAWSAYGKQRLDSTSIAWDYQGIVSLDITPAFVNRGGGKAKWGDEETFLIEESQQPPGAEGEVEAYLGVNVSAYGYYDSTEDQDPLAVHPMIIIKYVEPDLATKLGKDYDKKETLTWETSKDFPRKVKLKWEKPRAPNLKGYELYHSGSSITDRTADLIFETEDAGKKEFLWEKDLRSDVDNYFRLLIESESYFDDEGVFTNEIIIPARKVNVFKIRNTKGSGGDLIALEEDVYALFTWSLPYKDTFQFPKRVSIFWDLDLREDYDMIEDLRLTHTLATVNTGDVELLVLDTRKYEAGDFIGIYYAATPFLYQAAYVTSVAPSKLIIGSSLYFYDAGAYIFKLPMHKYFSIGKKVPSLILTDFHNLETLPYGLSDSLQPEPKVEKSIVKCRAFPIEQYVNQEILFDASDSQSKAINSQISEFRWFIDRVVSGTPDATTLDPIWSYTFTTLGSHYITLQLLEDTVTSDPLRIDVFIKEMDYICLSALTDSFRSQTLEAGRRVISMEAIDGTYQGISFAKVQRKVSIEGNAYTVSTSHPIPEVSSWAFFEPTLPDDINTLRYIEAENKPIELVIEGQKLIFLLASSVRTRRDTEGKVYLWDAELVEVEL